MWRGVKPLRFLKPCPRRILLSAFYIFLSIAGAIQTYAFIDDIPGLERPPLYDQLRGFEFWFPWVLFTLPIHLPIPLSRGVVRYFPSLGAVKMPLGSIIYSYVAASWLVYVWDRWVSASARRVRGTLLMLPAVLASLSGLSPLLLSLRGLAYTLSRFVNLYLVYLFYAISLYGLYKALGERLSSTS